MKVHLSVRRYFHARYRKHSLVALQRAYARVSQILAFATKVCNAHFGSHLWYRVWQAQIMRRTPSEQLLHINGHRARSPNVDYGREN